jgi:putative sterol carrier protein
MDSRDFFNMLSGQLKPANAFLSGKLKINGDMRKAMKMEKLMSSLKNKAKL